MGPLIRAYPGGLPFWLARGMRCVGGLPVYTTSQNVGQVKSVEAWPFRSVLAIRLAEENPSVLDQEGGLADFCPALRTDQPTVPPIRRCVQQASIEPTP